MKLDLQLILTLEMTETINLFIEEKAKKNIQEYKEDLKIKYTFIIEKLKSLADKIKDENIVTETLELITYVVNIRIE